MKKIALILAALTLGLAASAQTPWESEWVPRHEFHIDGFGGISNLNYKIDPGFASSVNHNFTDALGGGAGFGYTFHINEYFGITTGVEWAMYRGGFSSTKTDEPWIFYSLSNDNKDILALVYQNFDHENVNDPSPLTLAENQTIHSLQIPLMFQVMVPMNARKSNHFYVALGARIGFNLTGSYNRTFNIFPGNGVDTRGDVVYGTGLTDEYLTHTEDAPGAAGGDDIFDPNGPWANDQGWPWKIESQDATVGPQNKPADQVTSDEVIGAVLDNYQDMAPNEDEHGNPEYSLEKDLKEEYERLFPNDKDKFKFRDLANKGKLNTNLINVMACAELGFRWGLGNGWGLYTGVYFDYGFMPVVSTEREKLLSSSIKKGDNGAEAIESLAFTNGSLLGATYDKVTGKVSGEITPNGPNDAKITLDRSTNNIANKISNVGLGLKLKLAFGKVKKAPVAPIIEYRTDTLEKIIYIRDTVENTVVVKDTVTVEKTNTVIVRDTVTIIKEVPVEIQKTMMELSNTMFDFDKSIIKEAAKEPLNKVVKWLQENPELKVEISGHTDNKGSRAYNKKLSEARAKAVYDYFVSQGVNKFRLAYAGYGFDKPIATNETDEGRQLNRRVELNIVE